MKKFFSFLIIILVLIFWSWFVYNKFLYHIPVEDIPDSYFTYTGDIYTGTREDNGFYKMIDYFNDPKNEKILSWLNTIDQINFWTWDKKYYNDTRFNVLLLTWNIWTGEVYIEKLDNIDRKINYVLYTWFNLYDTLYGSWWQLSWYDKFIAELKIINNLSWEYGSQDIENHYFENIYFVSYIKWLLSISVLSCYLKDYDRCYNYRSQAYQLSRNMLYTKWPLLPSLSSISSYWSTLKLADFLIENNMIDDVMHQKMLADLELWNIYDTEQILHNMKVSEYNFWRYMIYNPEEWKRRLWWIFLSNEKSWRSNDVQQQFFFDQDLTHTWLKNILKNNTEIRKWYKYNQSYNYDTTNGADPLVKYWNNPEFNIYGYRLMTIKFPGFDGVIKRLIERLSYRDRVLQKYKDYTPTIIREAIGTGAVEVLSWSQNTSWSILWDDDNLTGDIDVGETKKDLAYCKRFKDTMSLYMQCVRSIE